MSVDMGDGERRGVEGGGIDKIAALAIVVGGLDDKTSWLCLISLCVVAGIPIFLFTPLI